MEMTDLTDVGTESHWASYLYIQAHSLSDLHIIAGMVFMHAYLVCVGVIVCVCVYVCVCVCARMCVCVKFMSFKFRIVWFLLP